METKFKDPDWLYAIRARNRVKAASGAIADRAMLLGGYDKLQEDIERERQLILTLLPLVGSEAFKREGEAFIVDVEFVVAEVKRRMESFRSGMFDAISKRKQIEKTSKKGK